uniref:Uncharacterized protein n=1 Tax=Arion vulgaris TaxID=1028688 RepID=A0A0B7A3M9_9EUPU
MDSEENELFYPERTYNQVKLSDATNNEKIEVILTSERTRRVGEDHLKNEASLLREGKDTRDDRVGM